MTKRRYCMIFIIIIILGIILTNIVSKIDIEFNPYNFDDYPEEGFIPNEEAVLELAKCHLKVYTGYDYNSDEFDTEYDNKMQVYKIKLKPSNLASETFMLDDEMAMILRKKDAKILYFSMYNGLP